MQLAVAHTRRILLAGMRFAKCITIESIVMCSIMSETAIEETSKLKVIADKNDFVRT